MGAAFVGIKIPADGILRHEAHENLVIKLPTPYVVSRSDGAPQTEIAMDYSDLVFQSMDNEIRIMRHLKWKIGDLCHAAHVDDGFFINREASFGISRVPYLVIERLKGETLADIIDRRGEAGMSAVEVVPLVFDLMLLMSDLHRARIIHGDLAPHNIFIDSGGYPFAIDFGLAGLVGESHPVRRSFYSQGFVNLQQLHDGASIPVRDFHFVGTSAINALLGKIDPQKCLKLIAGNNGESVGYFAGWRNSTPEIRDRVIGRLGHRLASLLDLLMQEKQFSFSSHAEFLEAWMVAAHVEGIYTMKPRSWDKVSKMLERPIAPY
jgi:serine/threonine protein kinase